MFLFSQLADRLSMRLDELTSFKKQVQQLNHKLGAAQAGNLQDKIIKINDVSFLSIVLKGLDRKRRASTCR